MNTTNKEKIPENGFVFSFDAGIASIIIMAILFLAAAWNSQEASGIIGQQKKFELWKNIVFVSDAMVKNNSGERVLGSAAFDSEKRRAKSNEIDFKFLENTRGFENPEFELKKIKMVFPGADSEKVFFEKKPEKNNCIAVERIVLAEGKIAKLVLEGCA